MDRAPESDAKKSSPEVRAIYEAALRGETGSMQKLLARRPGVLPEFLAFYGTVGRTLDRRVYEMVYLRISALNGCDHCVRHHVGAAQRLGLTPQDCEALTKGSYGGFDVREQSALRFADSITRDPDQVGATEVEALRAHFSGEQIVDLDILVGLANLTSRLADPLTAEVEGRREKE